MRACFFIALNLSLPGEMEYVENIDKVTAETLEGCRGQPMVLNEFMLLCY